MLYYLFHFLREQGIFSIRLFEYISFRAAAAFLLAIFIFLIFGKRFIYFLQRLQIGEQVRDLGLEGQLSKKGTPTMGGILIVIAILAPCLLLTKLHNIYIILMLFTVVFLGFLGFLDDYIKVFKKNKAGLSGKFKLIGQFGIGLVVATVLFFHPSIVIREKNNELPFTSDTYTYTDVNTMNATTWVERHDLKTTIPFLKNNEFLYSDLLFFVDQPSRGLIFAVFCLVIIFIVTAVSNGANLTDGLDGLAAGTSAISGFALAVLAYVSGHYVLADYLNIMYVPYSGELVVFIAAFMGAMIGFLWYNAYPAQLFMGDTGSLMIGGVIAVFAILVRKEFLLPLIGGVFLIENLSVILQVSYFKYTKKKYGEGRRIFLMSPLHHHFQKKNIFEPKIVARFWIFAILLAVFSIVSLKIR